VVASGRGAVAEQILQIAFERGVKVRTDSDLAEILAAVEVESEIPLAALAGVAEILRYLYRTDAAPPGDQRQETPGSGQDADAD
jgi:flagellar biosynthesis protein